jgi:AAA domain
MTARTHIDQAPIERIRPLLKNVRVVSVRRDFAASYRASCPCARHERGDQRPSLDIDVGADGTVVFSCRSLKCEAKEIVEAIGLTLADLFPKQHTNGHTNGAAKPNHKPKGKAYPSKEEAIAAAGWGISKNHPGAVFVGVWDYPNATGKVDFAVARWNLPGDAGKEFRPIHLAADGWRIGDPPGKLPLLYLPELLAADRSMPVYVVEGEGKAALLRSFGLLVTTSAHGSESPQKTDWTPLAGRVVIILPDADKAGEGYAAAVAGILQALGVAVKVVRLPGLEPGSGDDVKEFIECRRTDGKDNDAIRAEIEALVASAAPAPEPLKEPAAFAEPVLCSQLTIGTQNGEWLWHGYIMERSATLLSALWKAGKSTLTAHLLRAFGDGSGIFCGRTVMPSNVLVVTEESEARWVRRRDDLKLGDNLRFMVRPFKTKPTKTQWLAFIEYVTSQIKKHDVHLVVLDSLSSLWPVGDENDAAQVQEALTPLNGITEVAALLLVHHIRKSDGGEGTASRGSGALPSHVDTIVELRRHDAANKTSTKRVLTAYGRWDETPPDLVIEYDAEAKAYRDCGDRQQDRLHAIKDIILGILPRQRPGMGQDDIRSDDHWPDRVPTKATVLQAFQEGTDAKPPLWIRDGEGRKGSPFTYWVQES